MADPLSEAMAHQQAGRLVAAEAAYAAALAADPDNAEAWHLRGLAAHQAGHLEAALRHIEQALARRPDFAEAHNSRGGVLLASGDVKAALSAFDAALEQAPDLGPARYNRAKTLLVLGQTEAADEALRDILAQDPAHQGARCDLAMLQLRQGESEAAAALLQAGLEQQPSAAKLWANLALVLEALNDLDGAESAAKQAAGLEADSPALSLVRARIEERRGDLTPAAQRLAKLSRQGLAPKQHAEVMFELGRLQDKRGRYRDAFSAFTEANRMQAVAALGAWDGDRFLRQAAINRNWFTAERMRRLADGSGAGPVFFVGFPRSGTTLVERALAAHPGVVTSEERSPLVQVLRALRSAGRYPQLLEAWTADDRTAAQRGFWQAAEELAGPLEGHRFVDKLPLNLVELGLANLLFPEARVIVALRDPRDVCLSCFMQHFQLNDAMANFLDLGQTARCYAAVMDLWLAYRAALTLPWCELRYEDLVTDFEGELARLLEFLGLPWDDAVLRFREGLAGKAVTTPSYRQVTAPLSDRAIGRWRHYRKELAPILPLLAPYVEAFGYDETES